MSVYLAMTNLGVNLPQCVGLLQGAHPRINSIVGLEEVAVKSLDGQLELVLVDDQPDVHLGGALAEHQHLHGGCVCTQYIRSKTTFHVVFIWSKDRG